MRILLNVAYDGTDYYGFQIQKKHTTIQQKIQEALKILYKKDVPIIGASRTDSGVHALGQKIVYDSDNNSIPVENIPKAMNSILPKDIVINNSKEVHNEFHPRYDAKLKIYNYKILNSKYMIPQLRNYSTHCRCFLDIEKMQTAGKFFIGTYDFIGFSSAGSSVKSTVRTIFDLKISKANDFIDIEVKGDGFLYNMVRIIAGILIDVGRGKINPYDIEEIILSGDRKRAGKTAEPNGLTLVDILY